MEAAILSSIDEHFEIHEGIVSHFNVSTEHESRHPTSPCQYLLVGAYKNPRSEFIFKTSQDGLKNATSFVYSLHKKETANSNALACFDKTLDHDLVAHKELLAFPWEPCKAVKQSPEAKPSPKVSPTKTSVVSSSTTRTAAPISKRQSVKRPAKSANQSSLVFNAKKTEPAKPVVKAPVDPEPIHDPFADSEDDDVDDDDEGAKENSPFAGLTSRRRRLVFSSDDDDDDEEEEDGKRRVVDQPLISSPSPRKKTSKIVPKKDAKCLPSANYKSPKRKAKSPRKPTPGASLSPPKKAKAAGENAVEASAAKALRPPERPPAPGGGGRRRQVTKTFVDDEGFLSTFAPCQELPV
ncbi:unnamed protein product [Mesocestoides corti]|uniref:DNA polymerase delta subunit 3 n=1 Tax=Mesocestoides corti TaxID=53468 RepID=A0A158QSB1_MESCO|nr:unnamed protein product [Mesocestoides corti]